ncbi:hypothetical protein NQ317_000835 [Molorchus minor]|uniref:C2H2-type domain-containing protein n=1 Tax=Molorchus minor TaxID=1323400 RepID=A0ABQ9J8E6_9CUCU|nr:hypothetical protein NQ317_000835 [Molorchus minor]
MQACEEFHIVQPVVCLPCVDLLINYFKFASTSASVEEIINEYCQQEGTNSNGFVNFNDVVKFSHGEAARCGVTFNTSVVKETLSSDDDSDFKEVDIKIEEHDLKDEVGIDLPNESHNFAEDSKPANLENGEITHALCSDLRYECPLCQFKMETKADLRSHVGIHIVEPNAESIGDVACVDKSDNQSYPKRHVTFDDKSVVVETNRSGTCDFTAKCKVIFKNHSLVHSSETFCGQIDTNGQDLVELNRFYKNENERKILRKQTFNIGNDYRPTENNEIFGVKSVPRVAQQKMVVHRKNAEVKMYECESCHFKTKHRGSFINHRLVHRENYEEMYKCDVCDF